MNLLEAWKIYREANKVMKGVGIVKTGFKTSEFIVALIGMNIPVLNQQLGWNIPTESVVAITTIVIAYITSRTVAKRNGNNGSNPIEPDKPK